MYSMKSDPLVSVIVTCYNQHRVIANTLRSVQEQSHKNIECFVVDDGSTDDSAKAIREIAKADARIRYIRTANRGVSIARNTGFAEARGEFIQFLDGDDMLAPEKLERQLAHFHSDISIDVSYTNHRHFMVRQDRFETFPFEPIETYPLNQLLYGWHNGVSLPVHAPLYRRSIWMSDESPYPNDYPGRCEDWVFLVLVAAKGVKFSYLNQVLCTYAVDSNCFTQNITKLCTAFIQAAQYLERRLPGEVLDGFLESVIRRSLHNYHEAHRSEVLYGSGNWRLGNMLTKPFARMLRAVRRVAENREQDHT